MDNWNDHDWEDPDDRIYRGCKCLCCGKLTCHGDCWRSSHKTSSSTKRTNTPIRRRKKIKTIRST